MAAKRRPTLSPDELACERIRAAKKQFDWAKREFDTANEELVAAIRAFDEHVGMLPPELA